MIFQNMKSDARPRFADHLRPRGGRQSFSKGGAASQNADIGREPAQTRALAVWSACRGDAQMAFPDFPPVVVPSWQSLRAQARSRV
jgi:hypothetical protein